MRLFLAMLVLATFCIVGCGSHQRPIVNTVNTLDSTRVDRSVRVRDSLVKIREAVSELIIHEKDLDEKPQSHKEGNATVTLYKEGDSIHASAKCDSLELQLQLKDSIINTFRYRETDKTVTLPPERIKYTPGFVKFLAWSGGAFWLIIIGCVLIRIFKPKFI